MNTDSSSRVGVGVPPRSGVRPPDLTSGVTSMAVAEQGLDKARMNRVAFASLIGTTVEWYDFYIYGTAAALVFPHLFFPDFSPAAGLLASLSTYAVGFAARPLGGAVFGHFGDRVGRKKMLVVS